ncbi:MAG: hypothetical protein ACR2HJ_02130 [Fimbriimonadales bacterium]
MRCSDCPRFDEGTALCKDGKLNPGSRQVAIDVAQQFGPRSICMMNDHREMIVDVWQGNQIEGKPTRRPHTPTRKWHLEI